MRRVIRAGGNRSDVVNNTLTGLALVLVLALVAALIGPWFVNWNTYRAEFARQASVMLGAPVTVSGAVDARLLPSPYLRFRDLAAGDGAERLTISEVEITLALAPLLRGELKAERVKLVHPRLEATVAADGSLGTPFHPREERPGEAERISFDRAEIVGGAVALATPSGAIAIDRIEGVAEAGSLKGPFRFDGSLVAAGTGASIRASSGRTDAAGDLRMRVNVALQGRPEVIDFDGGLALGARPHIDGQATVTRPGTRTPKGETAPAQASQPWRITAKLNGDPVKLSFEQAELTYGQDEQALRIGARGAVTLGRKPRFDVAFESRQVDFDRAAGAGRPTTPAEIVALFADRLGAAPKPPIDGDLKLDVRGVVLAGDIVQDVSLALSADDGEWRIDDASAELPGGSPLKASGAIAFADAGLGFAGRVDVSTADLGELRRWLAGGIDQASTPVRRVGLRGDVTARPGALAIEDAKVTIDGATSTGRLAWRDADEDGGRARLEASMTSDRLDLDAFGAERLAAGLLRGSSLDVALALNAKSLKFGGVEMRDVALEGQADRDGLDLARLSVGDADGASISGSGRLAAQGEKGDADGRIKLHVEASRLAPLIALARAFGAPGDVLEPAARRAAALAPVKLDVELSAGEDGRRLSALGDVAGGKIDARLGAASLSLDAEADVDLLLTVPDARRLAALSGVETTPLAGASPGELTLRLRGALSKGMTGEARFEAFGIEAAGQGRLVAKPGAGLSVQGDATVRSADLAEFGEAIGRLTPGAWPALPANLAGRITAGSDGVAVESLKGEVAGRSFEGSVRFPADPVAGFSGALAFARIGAAEIAALGLSPEALAAPANDGGASQAPFGPSPVYGLTGAIDVTAETLDLAGGRSAADARFVLAFSPSRLAVRDFFAAVDGGRLTGSIALARSDADATVSLNAALTGTRAEALLGLAPDASPVAGLVDARLEAQGTGRSVAGLLGALTGAGSVTLTDAAIRRLDAAAVDGVEPQVEQGLALEAPKIAGAIERGLGAGDFMAETLDAPFTVSGGVLRAGPVTTEGATSRLVGGFSVDLAKATLDADFLLGPDRPQGPQVGVSFEGPVSTPRRRIDATALTGWLSVRAVERETARIEQMESDIGARGAAARQRFDEERRRQDEARREQARKDDDARKEQARKDDEARRKAEADRRKREAEARALLNAVPRPGPGVPQPLPQVIDISPPGMIKPMERTAPRAPDRQKAQQPDALPPPMVISPR